MRMRLTIVIAGLSLGALPGCDDGGDGENDLEYRDSNTYVAANKVSLHRSAAGRGPPAIRTRSTCSTCCTTSSSSGSSRGGR